MPGSLVASDELLGAIQRSMTGTLVSAVDATLRNMPMGTLSNGCIDRPVSVPLCMSGSNNGNALLSVNMPIHAQNMVRDQYRSPPRDQR